MWEKLSQVSIVLGIIASLKTLFALLKWIIPILSWRNADFCFENLRKDPSEDKRKKPIETLVKIGKKSASRNQQAIIKQCIEAMNLQEDSRLREAAAIILGKIGEPSVVPLIDEYEDDSSIIDKNFIECAFQKMKSDQNVKKTLVSLLNDEIKWRRRHGAIIALGEIEEVSVIDDLIRIINKDEQWKVRMEAISVVGKKFRDAQPISISCLVRKIGDENEKTEVRIAAVEALENIGDNRKEVVERLVTQAENQNNAHPLRLRIIKALGEMKVDSASSSLINLLYNENIDIMKASIKSLCQICDQNALVNQLKDMVLSHENYEIRKACIESFRDKEWNLHEVIEILDEVISRESDRSNKELAIDVMSYIREYKME